MTIANDLDDVAELCKSGAKQTLGAMLELGPKPGESTQAMLWDQQATRLQGQLNSLSALVPKLTAAAVIEGLQPYEAELTKIAAVSKKAEAKIGEIQAVSELLTKLASVLDLGLALLAAAASPSVSTVAALIKAGTAVGEKF